MWLTATHRHTSSRIRSIYQQISLKFIDAQCPAACAQEHSDREHERCWEGCAGEDHALHACYLGGGNQALYNT
jgi:hypothetical protein